MYKRFNQGLKLFSSLGLELKKNKHFTEAIDAELLLVDPKGKTSNYKKYLFMRCGHYSQFQPTHVRSKSITCSSCLEDKYREQVANSDLEYISRSSKPEHNLYRRKSCGHVLDITAQDARQRTTSQSSKVCPYCYEQKLIDDASRMNMTLLGKATSKAGVFRKYRFNSCGHARDVSSSCVALGRVVCRECLSEKYKQEAESVGLVFNGTATDQPSIKRNYILSCGHTKDIRLDHVRNGSWICTECGETHYSKSSNVYLLKIKTEDFEWLKLGYAANVKLRTTSYGLPKGSNLEVLFSTPLDKGIDALHLEKTVHATFKNSRLDKKLMEKYHKHNGYTECYPVNIESEILEVLSGLCK